LLNTQQGCYIPQFRKAMVPRPYKRVWHLEVAIYGVCPASKAPGMIDRMIYSPKPKVFQFLKPAGVKIMNFITRFVLRRYRFISLEEINEKDLDKMADRRYQSFSLESNSLSPLDMIAVTRSRKNNY